MSVLARAWIACARARQRLGALRGAAPPREELVRSLARGHSFLDVGCMWSVDGAIAFAAEEAGATAVTGLDVMAPSPRFQAERRRRASAVRFIQGDVHDEAVVARVGVHDVVWCSGVLYHAPDPLLTLRRLRALCGERLVLATESLPELPGLPGACVFYPALSERQRRAYRPRAGDAQRVGLDVAFDAAREYENWYWGITPSALDGMLRASGFEPGERFAHPLHLTVIARPV